MLFFQCDQAWNGFIYRIAFTPSSRSSAIDNLHSFEKVVERSLQRGSGSLLPSRLALHLNNRFSETSISSRSSKLVGKWSNIKKERERDRIDLGSPACEFSSIVGWGDQLPTWFIEAAGWAGQGRGRWIHTYNHRLQVDARTTWISAPFTATTRLRARSDASCYLRPRRSR